jgi:fumarate hydratase class I
LKINVVKRNFLLHLYWCISGDYVSTFDVKGKKCLNVEPEALTLISEQAMIDVAHLLRPAHLQVIT